MDHPVMEAVWAECLPGADGESRFWAVGQQTWLPGGHCPTVTRITVQQDLPGLHCNMRRVCVWVGDALVAEAPMHAVQAVGYPLPQGGE